MKATANLRERGQSVRLDNITRGLLRSGSLRGYIEELSVTGLTSNPTIFDHAIKSSTEGEGRWTIKAAIDEGVPVPVLTTALYERFSSRGDADFQDKLLSAMRFEFGGHQEKPVK